MLFRSEIILQYRFCFFGAFSIQFCVVFPIKKDCVVCFSISVTKALHKKLDRDMNTNAHRIKILSLATRKHVILGLFTREHVHQHSCDIQNRVDARTKFLQLSCGAVPRSKYHKMLLATGLALNLKACKKHVFKM